VPGLGTALGAIIGGIAGGIGGLMGSSQRDEKDAATAQEAAEIEARRPGTVAQVESYLGELGSLEPQLASLVTSNPQVFGADWSLPPHTVPDQDNPIDTSEGILGRYRDAIYRINTYLNTSTPGAQALRTTTERGQFEPVLALVQKEFDTARTLGNLILQRAQAAGVA